MFYKKGLEIGTRKELLDYVWFVQIGMQKGYSFSVLHSLGYSYILLQQLNLVYHYNPNYWNTAFLLVESGSLEMEQLQNNEDDGIEEDKKDKEKTTNYGTIAKAIGTLQNNNVKVALPDINKAELGFVPDVGNEQIIFGLKGVMKINNETSKLIMSLRPFESFEDVYNKMVLTKREVTLKTGKKQMKSLLSNTQMEMLIKGGAFDELEKDITREELLKKFLLMINPPKKSITGKQIEKVIQMGIVPSDYALMVRFYRYRNYIMSMDYLQDEQTKSIKWYLIYEDYAIDFFNEHFINDLVENRDYKYNENGEGIFVALGTKRKGSFEDIYVQKIAELTKYINSKACLDLYNEMTFNEIKKEKMQGNISTWEMEALNFYYHEHELAHLNKEKYNVSNFFELPEEPQIVGYTKYRDKQYPKFNLTRIAGTVLDRDKNKHIVTLLTVDGVISVKFQQGQFAFYDKTISIVDEDTGSKITLENGWFSRGQKLLITGFRRGDQFRPKRYKNSIYQHSVAKIVNIDENGNIDLLSERANVGD